MNLRGKTYIQISCAVIIVLASLSLLGSLFALIGGSILALFADSFTNSVDIVKFGSFKTIILSVYSILEGIFSVFCGIYGFMKCNKKESVNVCFVLSIVLLGLNIFDVIITIALYAVDFSNVMLTVLGFLPPLLFVYGAYLNKYSKSNSESNPKA